MHVLKPLFFNLDLILFLLEIILVNNGCAEQCGDVIILNDTNVKTLSFQYQSLAYHESCNIIIQGLPGYKIEAVINVDFKQYEYLQIYDRKDYLGMLQGRITNVYKSTTGDRMTFHYSTSSIFGFLPEERFNITYQQYMSSCGQEFISTITPQNISVVSSFNNTIGDVNCFWIIKRSNSGISSSKLIELTINDLLIGNNSFLEVSGELEILKRFDAGISKPVTLYGNIFGVRYRGDLRSSGMLFSAIYKANQCQNTYQLKNNETSAYVSPLLYNILPNTYINCYWNFYAQANYNLVVKVEFKGSARLGFIYVYDNVYNPTNIERIYTDNQSAAYISKSGFIRLQYRPFVNNATSLKIKVTYKQFTHNCENFLNATLVSKNIISDATKATDCVWNIQGVYVNLTINSLQLAKSDYLEVFDGPYQMSTFDQSLSSSVILVTRTSLGMKVHYHTSSTSGTRHFYATYQKVNCDETYQIIGTSKYTLRPQFPSYLYHDTISVYQTFNQPLICNIYLEAQKTYLIEMTIQQTSNDFFNFSTMVYDIPVLRGSVESGINVNSNIISNALKLHLKMKLDISAIAPIYQLSNISIGVTVMLRQFKPTCGKKLVANSTNQIIPSPEYHGTITNVDCVWVIRVVSRYRYVQLVIDKLDMEDEDGYLEVMGNMNNLEKI